MFKHNLLKFIFFVLIFIIHQSFALTLDWRFNLWPAILTFTLFAFGEKNSLFMAILIGFLMDNMSILPFGSYLITFFLITVVSFLLAKNFITNRSFISLFILTFISIIIFNFLLWFLQIIYLWFNLLEKTLIININTIIFQLITNTVLIMILYLTFNKFTNKLKTNLIINE